MNIQFEITLRGFKNDSVSRVQELLKDFYWFNAPEDWQNFDGDIKVNHLQPTDGNRVLLEIADNWAEWTYKFLQKSNDVRRIQIRYNSLSKDFIRKHKSLENYPEHYYEDTLIQM